MKVVVVEDDVLLYRHYERLLQRADINEIYHASHAVKAIDVIDEVHPNVIIADMLLTGSTVLPLFHELKSHDDLAHIPIVLITNLAADVSLEMLKPYGVKRILDKMTMTPADFIASVRSMQP